MEGEDNRFNSFKEWPLNSPVEPMHLARNGFFATGRFLEAQCHWCGTAIQDWDYGDNVADRHKTTTPNCVFIINPKNCGNVPRQNVYVPPERDMFNEDDRFSTFKNWRNMNIAPRTLAKAGFYYLNRSDVVKCAWCHGVIAKWMAGDDAFKEHQRLFPDCPRAKLGTLVTVAEGLGDLSIQPAVAPKNPRYASLDARIRTYDEWTIPHIQDPILLARAGLYFQGLDDQVRCFHCNIGLRSWQKDDDPLAEHAYWSSDCHFVRLALGTGQVPVVGRKLAKNTNTAGEAAAAATELPTSTSRLSAETNLSNTPNEENATTEATATAAATEENAQNNAKDDNLEKPSKPTMSLEEEHRHLKEARLCKICLDEEVGVVFLPCGHLVSCYQCAPSITQCPICRATIKGVVRAYLS